MKNGDSNIPKRETFLQGVNALSNPKNRKVRNFKKTKRVGLLMKRETLGNGILESRSGMFNMMTAAIPTLEHMGI